MNCRYAELRDVPAITSMFRDLCFHIKESSNDPYWDFEDFPTELGQQIIEDYIQDKEKAAIVADDHGKLVGMILLEVIGCHLPLSSHQRIGYIAAGYVRKDYRKQGIMRTLEK